MAAHNGSNTDRPLTTGEVARVCQVAPRTVSKWIDSGLMAGWRIPGSADRRVDVATLIDFLELNGMDEPKRRLARFLKGAPLDWTGDSGDPGGLLVAKPKSPPSVPHARQGPIDPKTALGCVYFLRASGDGPIKIGFSSQPERRITDLKTASPVPLHCLGVMFGTFAYEAKVHAMFGAARIAGEWFNPTPELLDFIARNAMRWSFVMDHGEDRPCPSPDPGADPGPAIVGAAEPQPFGL